MLATPASVSAANLGPFESNDHANSIATKELHPDHSAASLLGMAEQQQGGRNPKRPRVEADKRRDALLHVQDKYADIDFTKYQKQVDAGDAGGATDGSVGGGDAGGATDGSGGGGDGSAGGGGATPPRFVAVRPVATALVRDSV